MAAAMAHPQLWPTAGSQKDDQGKNPTQDSHG